ncbi:MAG: hypothetical protein KA885_11680 [Spirochaetes bacterium]|nr:hypothetical protein [Spirochaetota bacterium]
MNLSTPEKIEIESLIKLESIDPEKALIEYKKLIEKYPNNFDLLYQYCWFLANNREYKLALEAVEINYANDFDEHRANILKAYNLVKVKEYEKAIDCFAKIFTGNYSAYLRESEYSYFNFLISLTNSFDYKKTNQYLKEFVKKYPILSEKNIDKKLLKVNETDIKQIYLHQENISGFLLFVDLVNSTQYKKEYPENWKARTIHFLMYTRGALQYIGFDFIKFIGDEVMMFFPFTESKSKSQIAIEIYYFILGKQNWYMEELNRFNPTGDKSGSDESNPHNIGVKICIGEVNSATVFNPYNDEKYDLIGEDVDRIARIKEVGYENLCIIDKGFKDSLAENGEFFNKEFSEMKWRQKFKGINEIVEFYGRFLPKVV